jgi:LysR family nitrogen assimilation transcriptional regulator
MRSQVEYLDLEALSVFVRLADRVHATSVARGSATGSVQAQIARLEVSLGVRLFESVEGNCIRLTQVGQRLHASGTELLAASKAAINSVAAVSRNPAELAVFAAPPTVAAVLASAVAARFHRELGSARLRFIEGMSGHIREWLATGRIDVGILLDSYGVPGEPLWSEDMFLVGDLKFVGEAADPVSFAKLERLPMLLPSAAHGLRQVIDRHAERAGIKLDVRLEGDSLNTLMDWAIEGLGVAVLPLGAVETHHRRADTLRLIPIESPKLERHLVLCTASNKHPSATVRALIRIIREEACRLKPAWSR